MRLVIECRGNAMPQALAPQGLLWPRPALIFSRTLLDALADLRTATPIYLATLKVVEELQFTDHPTARKLIPSGRFGPAVTLQALGDVRLYQSEIVQSRMLIGSGMSALGSFASV